MTNPPQVHRIEEQPVPAQAIECMENSRGFQISNLSGYTLSIGIGPGHYCDNNRLNTLPTTPLSSALGRHDSEKATTTMEVAILRDDGGGFCCLPNDVAGYVPVSKLKNLIVAVMLHDWARVCFLCGEDDSDANGKFPGKSERAALAMKMLDESELADINKRKKIARLKELNQMANLDNPIRGPHEG